MDIRANPHAGGSSDTHVDQPEVVRCSVTVHRQLEGSTKGLSTERLCTGREDRYMHSASFSPIAGLSSGGD